MLVIRESDGCVVRCVLACAIRSVEPGELVVTCINKLMPWAFAGFVARGWEHEAKRVS